MTDLMTLPAASVALGESLDVSASCSASGRTWRAGSPGSGRGAASWGRSNWNWSAAALADRRAAKVGN